jgi:hypothetical protein
MSSTKINIQLPFSGAAVENCCRGVKFAGGLFLQCNKTGVDVCKGCVGAPTIEERLRADFKDEKGRAPTHYSKIMKKNGWTSEMVLEFAAKSGITINEADLVAPEEGTKRAARKPKCVPEIETSMSPINIESEVSEQPVAIVVQENKETENKETEKEAKKAAAAIKKAEKEAKKAAADIKKAEKDAAAELKNAEKAEKQAAIDAKKLEIETKKAEKEAKKIEAEAKKAAAAIKKAEKDAKKAAEDAKKIEAEAKKEVEIVIAAEPVVVVQEVVVVEEVVKKPVSDEKDAKKVAAELKKTEAATKKAEKEAAAQAKKLAADAKNAEKEAKKAAAELKKNEKAAKKDVKKVEAKPDILANAVDEDEEEVEVEEFEFNGVTYLRSTDTNIVYDSNEDVVGKWNEATKAIDFTAELQEEEYVE